MKNKKRKISLIFILVFSCLVFATCGFADTGRTEREAGFNIRTGQIKTVSDLKAIKNVAIAEINEFTLAAADSSDVREALDDGTTLVVNNISDEGVEKLSEDLNLVFYPKEKNSMQTTYGAVIRKELSGEYSISEVMAEVAKREFLGRVIEPSEQDVKRTLAWIAENGQIDLTDMYYTLEAEDCRKSELIKNAGTAGLGSASLLGSDFYHDRMILSLYTSATEEDFTSYDVPSYRLAGIDVLLVGLKLKTVGTTTYNAFAADFIVGGDSSNGCKIVKYHGKLGTPSSSRYSIFGETLIPDSNQTITVSLNAQPWSVSGGLQYSYSYNTGGQNIVNHLNDNQYSKWWEVTPNNPAAGGSYRISPNLLVELKDGTTTKGTIKATFSYIKVNNGLASNWVSDVDKVLSFSYKNHAKVS